MNKLGKYQHNIIGHPGTGKTTRLGELVLSHLKEDVDYYSRRLMGANFSRSASWALKNKLMENGVSIDELPFFRTIHSLGAKVLDLKRKEDFFQPRKAKKFFLRYNIPYNPEKMTIDDIEIFGVLNNESLSVMGNGILYYFQYLKRVMILPKKIEFAIQYHRNIPRTVNYLNRLSGDYLLSLYHAWEEEKGGYEYDDILHEIYMQKRDFFADIEYAFIDEAQDLSPLQLEVLKLWLSDTEKVYIAFDLMQTIYFFNGSSPELIIGLERDSEEILRKSYRVPEVPWEHAKEIAYKNNVRTVDLVEPRDYDGDLLWLTEEYVYPLIKDIDGVAYVLFRGNADAIVFMYNCLKRGIFVRGLGRLISIFSDTFFIWIYNLFAKLYHDEPLLYDEVFALIKYIPARYLRRGVKTSFIKHKRNFWIDERQESLGEVDTHTLFFSLFKDVRNISELKEILSDPNVVLSTKYPKRDKAKKEIIFALTHRNPIITDKAIKVFVGTYHSVKGLECDTVILFDWLPPRQSDIREERNLAFVGITRARNNVFIIPVQKIAHRGILERDLAAG